MIPFSTDEFRDMGYRDNHAVLKDANESASTHSDYPIRLKFGV